MSKLSIDPIAKVEREIQEVNKKIDALIERRDMLLSVQKWLNEGSNGIAPKRASIKSATPRKVYAKTVKKKTVKKQAIGSVKISTFLMNTLGSGEKHVRDIVGLWARQVGRQPDDIYTSVSNALRRMGEKGHVGSKEDPRGARYGSIYFLI